MAIFQWKGIEGNQLNSGEIEAPNSNLAREKLQDKSIVVTNIVLISGTEETGEIKHVSKKKLRLKNVPNKDLMIFTKKFATMVRAGLPIMKTLHMLHSQTENKSLKLVLNEIVSSVEAGTSLSEAFSEHGKVFDVIYINMLKAGESSGKLTLFLEKLVIQLEKSEKIRNKVKGALRYPIILFSVAIGVITLMLIKVVPVFQQMFKSMGNNLPGPTQMIVNMSEFLRDPAKGGVLLIVIIAMFIGTKFLITKSPAARYKFDKMTLKIPILGDVIMKSTLAKIAMIQGNLSNAGVPVLEALSIISMTIKNVVFKEAFKAIQSGVSSGQPISALYGENELFPNAFHQMLAVGEETGSMDEMLAATAHYYEEEFDLSVDQLTEMLEPIMIVFMGITVGFIIVAMYMPIFEIGNNI